MLEVLKKFFTDETAFKGMLRSVILGLGALLATQEVPGIPEQLGVLIMAASGMIRAGDKNPG